MHTCTRADFFFGMYQLETRFARINNTKSTQSWIVRFDGVLLQKTDYLSRLPLEVPLRSVLAPLSFALDATAHSCNPIARTIRFFPLQFDVSTNQKSNWFSRDELFYQTFVCHESWNRFLSGTVYVLLMLSVFRSIFSRRYSSLFGYR